MGRSKERSHQVEVWSRSARSHVAGAPEGKRKVQGSDWKNTSSVKHTNVLNELTLCSLSDSRHNEKRLEFPRRKANYLWRNETHTVIRLLISNIQYKQTKEQYLHCEGEWSLHLKFYSMPSYHSRVWVGNFPGGPVVKSLPANARDTVSIPGSGRFHMLWGS